MKIEKNMQTGIIIKEKLISKKRKKERAFNIYKEKNLTHFS